LINKLFEYCNITLEMHLPSLWLALAKLNKKQDLSIMQDEVTTNTGSPNHFSQTAPIISPQLAQDLISLTFAVPLTDNIKMGLQPFMVSDGTEEHHANNMEVACDYRFLAEGMVRICSEPLTTLWAKETWSLPVIFFELEKCLEIFRNLSCLLDNVSMIPYERKPMTWLIIEDG